MKAIVVVVGAVMDDHGSVRNPRAERARRAIAPREEWPMRIPECIGGTKITVADNGILIRRNLIFLEKENAKPDRTQDNKNPCDAKKGLQGKRIFCASVKSQRERWRIWER